MPDDRPADSGFSDRMLGLLEARDVSIRAFQQSLEEAGAENSGYSSVFRYVKGEFPPTVEWVLAASKILEVSAGWLAFGDTPVPRRPGALSSSTNLDGETDFVVARALGSGQGDTATRASIIEGLIDGLGVHVHDAHLVGLESVFWRRWSWQQKHLPEDLRAPVHALAQSVGQSVIAPIKALGIDPHHLETFEMEFFLPFMYAPLMQLVGVFSDPEPPEETR